MERKSDTTGSQPRTAFALAGSAGYSIPVDGTVGDLMRETEIPHFRPAHIHFYISAPGYRSLITHLFKKDTRYIDSDVVFGVKEKLIAEFKRHPAGNTPTGEVSAKPFYAVTYDFVLSK
jgi:hydroxyquinol 1,2-dioxygenase